MPARPALLTLLLALATVPWTAPPATGRPHVPLPFGSDPYVAQQTYRGDFPDPTVLRARGRWFAYATSTNRMNLPVLSSGGLRTWRALPTPAGAVNADALPTLPAWAYSRQVGRRQVGMVWAPSVARVKGRFVAAYALRTAGTDFKMCLSLATSRSPQGPFVDRSTQPLVCTKRRGAIDPQFYREKGKWWLLYKTDDNAVGRPGRIWIRRLNARATGFTKASRPHRLLKAKMDWEAGVVENPSMIRFKGVRYLFYSGNGWGNPHYAIGYAVCQRITGPCKRVTNKKRRNAAGVPQNKPLIKRNKAINGPGGGFAFRTPAGRLRMAYHAWDKGFHRYPTSEACRETPEGCAQRRMYVAKLKVSKGKPVVVDLGLR